MSSCVVGAGQGAGLVPLLDAECLFEAFQELLAVDVLVVGHVGTQLVHQLAHPIDGILVRHQLLRHPDQPSIAPCLIAGVTSLLEGSLPTAPPAVLPRAAHAAVRGEPASAVCAAHESAAVVSLGAGPLLAHPTQHNVTVTL